MGNARCTASFAGFTPFTFLKDERDATGIRISASCSRKLSSTSSTPWRVSCSISSARSRPAFRNPLKYPPILPAHFEHALALAKPLAFQVEVLGNHQEPLLPAGRIHHFSRPQESLRLPEYPRLPDGAPANHHGVHAGLVEHGLDLLRIRCIAIANQGNGPNPFLPDPTQPFPTGIPPIHLAARASMDGQGTDARSFQHTCDFQNPDRIVVPSETSLHSHRPRRLLDHRLGNPKHLRKIAQNAGSSIPTHDLPHRATEIHVDQVRARPIHNRNRLAYLLDVTTKYLDAHGALLFVHVQLSVALFRVGNQPTAGYEFGVEHVRSVPLAQKCETVDRSRPPSAPGRADTG